MWSFQLSKAKTFHLSLSDLNRSEKSIQETVAEDSSCSGTAPTTDQTAAKNFPFYTEIVKKCLQSKSESVSFSQPMVTVENL